MGKTERRARERKQLEIRSVEDARQFVQLVGARNAENSSRVRAWRIAKQAAWLLPLVVAFLAYYLLDVVYQVVSLP
jgi:hypothetical protein